MLKKAVSIFLVTAMFTTLVHFTLPYIWYYSNYKYIATELCVNRDNPGMHCNGSCQLDRMIQKQHDHSDKKPTSIEQEQRMNMFFVERFMPFTAPDLFLNTLLAETVRLHSLWVNEPATPPPKAG